MAASITPKRVPIGVPRIPSKTEDNTPSTKNSGNPDNKSVTTGTNSASQNIPSNVPMSSNSTMILAEPIAAPNGTSGNTISPDDTDIQVQTKDTNIEISDKLEDRYEKALNFSKEIKENQDFSETFRQLDQKLDEISPHVYTLCSVLNDNQQFNFQVKKLETQLTELETMVDVAKKKIQNNEKDKLVDPGITLTLKSARESLRKIPESAELDELEKTSPHQDADSDSQKHLGKCLGLLQDIDLRLCETLSERYKEILANPYQPLKAEAMINLGDQINELDEPISDRDDFDKLSSAIETELTNAEDKIAKHDSGNSTVSVPVENASKLTNVTTAPTTIVSTAAAVSTSATNGNEQVTQPQRRNRIAGFLANLRSRIRFTRPAVLTGAFWSRFGTHEFWSNLGNTLSNPFRNLTRRT
jgi:hypothetical protein